MIRQLIFLGGIILIFAIIFAFQQDIPKTLTSVLNILQTNSSTSSQNQTSNQTVSNNFTQKSIMPALFLAHGSPSIVIEKGPYIDFLTQLHKTIKTPKAIVIFSAHWESRFQQISSVQQYSTIYDFSGFPPEMYKIKYPAPGSPDLAKEIQDMFTENEIASFLDEKRGLDHGVWTLLKLIYPKADIPVVALSVDPRSSPEELFRIGSIVSSLREKEILVIGSGGTVHNLGRLNWGGNSIDKWALGFDNWLEERINSWNTEELFEYKTKAPFARDAVPTPEHFIPIFVALGAGSSTKNASLLHRSYQYGSLSYMSWRFD